MNTILPIGSVLMLKNARQPLMIFGYLQKSAMFPDKVADYIGVPYPEGNLSMALQIGFMMSDIGEVLFEGYRTEDFKPWEDMLRLAEKRHQSED